MASLHIFNGDCAFELWRKCGFSAPHLVWRETYLEGPLPDTDDLHAFRLARAEFLASFDELQHLDFERLYRHLQQMDDTLLALSAADELMLWFDSCIFDQTLLMRILYLLQKQTTPLPEIFLYCCAGNVLQSDDFQRAELHKIRLQETDLQIAAAAWQFWARRDAAGLRQLFVQENFERLTAMQNALLRCAEEIPDCADGFTRTERQILEILREKNRSFSEIFQTLKTFEELPFLGDTACKRILNDLLRKGKLQCCGQEYSLLEK